MAVMSHAPITLDVVIPSARPDPERLAALLELDVPDEHVRVSYFVVADCPLQDLEAVRTRFAHRPDVTLLRNDTWLGAPGTRNRGLEAGTGEFVLFLDDDVVPAPGLLTAYAAAIRSDARQSPGYVGVTEFPDPHCPFTAGIVASDILTFFGLARTRPAMPWGVTANLCLRRRALDGVRFSHEFPKRGGGEDIDLCLRMAERAGCPLVSVPNAVVRHPWWGAGRRSYIRFARWAFGDSRLPPLFPKFRYRNAFTLPEAVAVLAIVSALLPSALMSPAAFKLGVAGMFAVELAVDYGKLRLRGQAIPIRVSVESSLVRLSNDLGRLLGNVSRLRLWAITERFDYFCSGESIAYERRIAFSKLLGWIGILALVLGLLR